MNAVPMPDPLTLRVTKEWLALHRAGQLWEYRAWKARFDSPLPTMLPLPPFGEGVTSIPLLPFLPPSDENE